MTKKELLTSLECLDKFKKLLIDIPKMHQSVSDEIELCQSEVTDILHDIEFSKLDRTSASRKAKHLQKVQRIRRENKEMQEITQTLNIFLQNNKRLISDISKIQSQVKSIVSTQENRVYAPRSPRTAMEAAFMHFNATDETLS